MADDKTQSSGESGDPKALRNRKERLASLKARHQDLVEEPAPAPAPTGQARAQAPGPLRGGNRGGSPAWLGQGAGTGGAQGFAAIGPQQRQMIGRIYRMLTQDPHDGTGLVPGTPFTVSGVEKLMGLLAQRAQEQGAPGSKIAQSALRFIEAREGEEEAVAGASLEKLQMLAKRAESLKVRAGAGGRLGAGF